MDTVRYCTPEWLEECFRRYQSQPQFAQGLQKLSVSLAFRVSAEPRWGIDRALDFGGDVENGRLLRLGFLSEDAAKREC